MKQMLALRQIAAALFALMSSTACESHVPQNPRATPTSTSPGGAVTYNPNGTITLYDIEKGEATFRVGCANDGLEALIEIAPFNPHFPRTLKVHGLHKRCIRVDREVEDA